MDDWWVMLPDAPAAAAVAERQRGEGVRRVPHASGRPWLVGRCDARQEVTARAGEARIVVLGRSTAQAGTLRRIERVRLPAEAERAVTGLAGSFHVPASVGGRVWARGTASAVCRVFTTHIDAVPVAAGRADVLAALSGADPDPGALAVRLLHPPVDSTVLADRTFWHDVRAVPAHEASVWERDGRRGPRVRWWRPPEPHLSLTEAAAEVRTALTDAVGTCTAGGGTVSASVHCALQQVREGGNTIRVLNQTPAGPDMALPYTDDAVGTAALSVRPLEAVRPGTYKPLLGAALAGLVPAHPLARPDKGPYDADFYHGLRRHRGELLALTEDPLLAEAGLIDTERLRRALRHHAAAAAELDPLLHTLGCEVWLRSLDGGGPAPVPYPPARRAR
ncbi:asparagine synthase-related protein [Streptomyces achromogenes]|uniref:asparagine synthase-related protein n=1 Tax=Streptomyces achromogenes TaxID=67255 RepID=UPI0036FFAF14